MTIKEIVSKLFYINYNDTSYTPKKAMSDIHKAVMKCLPKTIGDENGFDEENYGYDNAIDDVHKALNKLFEVEE